MATELEGVRTEIAQRVLAPQGWTAGAARHGRLTRLVPADDCR